MTYLADSKIFKKETGKNLTKFEKLKSKFDYILICQPHQFYLKKRIKF